MRVYLACTVRGDRSGVLAGRAICERLQHHGHEVLTTHLLTGCDVLVAEASGSSYGVGFEVGYVLGRAHQTGQRVLLLYNTERRHAISRLIIGNCDPACTTVGYTSIDDLCRVVDRHLPAH